MLLIALIPYNVISTIITEGIKALFFVNFLFLRSKVRLRNVDKKPPCGGFLWRNTLI